MVISQAVVCERTDPDTGDLTAYGYIYYLGIGIVFVFAFLMSFLHIKDKLMYIELWKKAIVGGIVVFFGSQADAVYALVGLGVVQVVFGVAARCWANRLGGDGTLVLRSPPLP